jgi:hypothetical protein
VGPRAQIERHEQRAQGRVGDDEAGVVAARGDVGDLHGQSGDGQHRGEHHRAEEDVVAVEAIGVEREPLPGDEDRQEEPGEDGEAAEAVVPGELLGQLRDGHNEDEVEEELEPGRVALVVPAVARRAQRRRAQPRPRAGRPLRTATAGRAHCGGDRRRRPGRRRRSPDGASPLAAPALVPGAGSGVSAGASGTDTAISPPSAKGGTSSSWSPLQKRPGSYQLGGRSLGSRPMAW